jgi:hypothetical protein
MAYWRGEPKVCSVAQPPSVEEEDAKRTHRERQFLMKERIQHIGRIKGLLATQGIYDFRPSRKDWKVRLGDVKTGDGRSLPPRLRAEIDVIANASRLSTKCWQKSTRSAMPESRCRRRRRRQPIGSNALSVSRPSATNRDRPGNGDLLLQIRQPAGRGKLPWVDSQPLPERRHEPGSGHHESR